MLSRVWSCAVRGVDGILISVEVDVSSGLPCLAIVGLPDASVREARDRVVAAVRNSGFDFPSKKITVNLAPAAVKKEGPAFDLPIAVGILAAMERVRPEHLDGWCLVGELALDGALKPARGILPMALSAKESGRAGMILPRDNAPSGAVVDGINIVAEDNLAGVIRLLNQDSVGPLYVGTAAGPRAGTGEIRDFADVKGQAFAKRALEVASAGGHNVLMVGPPGSGKSMLSRRLPSILPPLTREEAIETTKVHSVSGADLREGLIWERPFRSPHHSISDAALIGGGSVPRPGEVSLAHNGVLFLDELPEFHRGVIEVMRQPLESRRVTVARAKDTLTFPAKFMLVAAMNPCPCGFRGHPLKECLCSPVQVAKYMGRISGPLLDRIDIQIEVPALKMDEISADEGNAEKSEGILARVAMARERQLVRSAKTNAEMNTADIRRHCCLDEGGKSLLRAAMTRLNLSARAFHRILKVARTISDLESSESIQVTHVAEAIQYRSLDRQII